jgi:hypothetical protein
MMSVPENLVNYAKFDDRIFKGLKLTIGKFWLRLIEKAYCSYNCANTSVLHALSKHN